MIFHEELNDKFFFLINSIKDLGKQNHRNMLLIEWIEGQPKI